MLPSFYLLLFFVYFFLSSLHLVCILTGHFSIASEACSMNRILSQILCIFGSASKICFRFTKSVPACFRPRFANPIHFIEFNHLVYLTVQLRILHAWRTSAGVTCTVCDRQTRFHDLSFVVVPFVVVEIMHADLSS